MANVVRVHEHGGPEMLKYESMETGEPGPGEIRLRQHAVGLNFLDVYYRTGLYKPASMPHILGHEGAGEVTALGEGVRDLKVGDRVAYASAPGAYADERLIAADRVVKLPDNIDYQTAAAMMLQGMTVRYLLRETYRVGPETVLLFHAAAGGVGLIACQWAQHLGATIIGTVSSAEKAKLARENGCTHVIDYKTENFVERVKEITGGKGCDVVYDSVGNDTFPGSLDSLKPRGLWVSFGNASGPVPPFPITLLSQKGSLFATRPSLFAYTSTRAELVANANELFDMVTRGIVKIKVGQTYKLLDAAQAHRDLEARKTVGATVLLP